jgi:hypothetical protein
MIWRFSAQQVVQGLLLVLVLLFPFLNLHLGSLKPWDEALTGERIREMAENHQYLTPHLYGEPDFNKPPLYYLISQPLWAVLGPGELPVRFWSVVFATACAVLAYLAVVSAGLRRSWGLMAALLLLLNPHWQNWTRMGLLDSGMALSILLGLRLLCRRELSLKQGLWAGVVLGCGCLIKMPVVLVVVPIAAFSNFMLWRRLAWRPLLLALAVGAGFMMVWAGLQFALYGQEWLDFQKYNFVERFNTNIEGHATSNAIYWDHLLQEVRFEFMLLLVALVAALWTGWRAIKANLPELLFLLIWVFLVLWTSSNRSTYLLPAYPFAAVVTASLLGGVLPEASRRLALVLVACLAVANLAVNFDFVPDNSPHMAAIGEQIRSSTGEDDFIETTVKLERHVLAFYSHGEPGYLNPEKLDSWMDRRLAEPGRGGFLVVEKGEVIPFEKRLITRLYRDFQVQRVLVNGRFGAFRLQPATPGGPATLLHHEGWFEPEKWGRWAVGPQSRLQALGVRLPARLTLEAASWLSENQEIICEVRRDGQVLATLNIATRPWQWQEYSVDIPGEGEGDLDLELHFPAAGGDDGRSLPVRKVRVTPRS